MWLVVLVLVVVLVVFSLLVVNGRNIRCVHVDVALERIFPDHVEPHMLHGVDGARIIAYHGASGALIGVVKSLSPQHSTPLFLRRWGPGRVRMRVIKVVTSVQRLEHFRARWPRRRRWLVPYWQLPSPEEGEKAEEIECGASLSKVKVAFERLLSGEPALAGYSLFFVWSERSAVVPWTVGNFEEAEV
jgi:hypothetical protein